MNKNKLKEFITFLKTNTSVPVKSEELLEKDFYITLLLEKIKNDEYAFKGGTCLSKIYLDYYRISEDLDFTFINQKLFDNKSTKEIKKLCSAKITVFANILKNISKEQKFDFRPEKGNKKYIEIGSNTKLVTFKIWYSSVFTGMDSFIKIQLTFPEILRFQISKATVEPLITTDTFHETDRTYFHEYISVYKPFTCFAYDISEIAAEKIRAILTRKGIKTRDIFDLYFIEKIHKINIRNLKEICIEKINFATNNYAKYKKSIRDKMKLSNADLITEDATHLMLTEIDKRDFDDFTQRLFIFLDEIKTSLALKAHGE